MFSNKIIWNNLKLKKFKYTETYSKFIYLIKNFRKKRKLLANLIILLPKKIFKKK